MIWRTLWLAAAALLLSPVPALAQTSCDQFRAAITTGPQGPIERVPAVGNTRVYLCGYVILKGAQTLDFEITSGKGVNCALERTVLIPRTSVPDAGIFNRIPYATGERTGQGHAVCLQTWGNAAASLTSIFYWTQF